MMAYIYSGIVSLAVAILAFALQSVIRENRDLKRKQKEEASRKDHALEYGVQCLLRDRLIFYHAKHMKDGYVSSKDLENGLAMYDAYKGLGGNGMIDRMKEEIEELHIDDEH